MKKKPSTKPEPTISRTAQAVALALFPMGSKCHVTFNTPSRIGPQCKKGLEELVKAGMVKLEKDRGKEIYHATKKIGFPMSDFKPLKPSEPESKFAIVTP